MLVDALRRQPGIESVEVTPAGFTRAPRSVYRSMGTALSGSDLAHIQYTPAFFGGMNPLRQGWSTLLNALTVPALVTIHELDLSRSPLGPLPGSLAGIYRRAFFASAMRHAAVRGYIVHAVTLREHLINLGIDAGAVTLQAMPLEQPSRPGSGDKFRVRRGLIGRRLLLIPGFLARRKGYATALRALAQLPPEWLLVAAGGEHATDTTGTAADLTALAADLRVRDRFIITVFLPVEELEDAVAAADIILAPYSSMAASAALAFALARGKAVVASDLPENRALPCLRLFPTGDADALAGVIRELGENPESLAQLGAASLAYAAGHSYERTAEETARLYGKVLGK